MRSFKPLWLLVAGVLLAGAAFARVAGAQAAAQGFALERLYLSAPGGGWFVMDDLSMHGNLGGTVALTTAYARKPLRVGSAADHVPVVSNALFTDFGFAATYERFRFYLNLSAPIATGGRSGTVNGYQLTAPTLNPSTTPDSFADARIATDIRVLGEADSPFRLGVSTQLFFPTGKRFDYDSDGTYRAMGRALFAGDLGIFSYAGQLGVHIRPLNESPTPASPRGSELLFGAAAGLKYPLGRSGGLALLAGPELFGETAFNSFFGSSATGLEALFSARLEQQNADGSLLRLKLASGAGIDPHFGAPEWRVVCAIELSDQALRAQGP